MRHSISSYLNSNRRGVSVTRRLLLGLPALLILWSTAVADGGDIKSQQQRLQTVRDRIALLQKEIESSIGERGQLEQQLAGVEKQLSARYRDYRNLQIRLRKNRNELRDLKRRSHDLNDSLRDQQEKLASQLRTAYFIGNQEQLKILLNQQDPAALTRILKYFEYFNRARIEVINAARSTLKQINETQLQIERQNAKLSSLTEQSRQQYEQIRIARNQRREVLEQLKQQIKSNKNSVITLRQDENQIRELIAKLSGVFSDIPPEMADLSFHEQKGLLPWPVEGDLLNYFGQQRIGSDLSWRGVRIGAPRGREVRAISHGRVAFADWIPVFGLILLIDHSDGYMSLYAHNQSLYKDTGDWVRAGEVISNVGDSGGEEQNMLYFEIRHNGKPLDPAKWCASRRS